MICECQPKGLPCADTGRCLLCAKASRPEPQPVTQVVVPVSDYEAILQYRRRIGYAAQLN